ncbi:MAG: acyl-CoA thioesterase [Acidobacteria bacterium]|nr:acyl-CoA thioesterase [Acidobacteriota bacterium]
MEKFKILTKIKVRFGDLDAFRHVNAPKYFSYLEEGRLELFGKIKGNYSLEGIDFIVAHLEGDFIAPVHFGEEVVLGTGITRIGKTSVSLYQEIYSNCKLCFKAKSVVVFYDFKSQTKKSVPDVILKNAQSYIVKEE